MADSYTNMACKKMLWSDMSDEDPVQKRLQRDRLDPEYSTTIGADSDPESLSASSKAETVATTCATATVIASEPTIIEDGDSDGSVTTFKTDASSRVSASRPAYARGPKRRQAKAARSEQRMRERLGAAFKETTVKRQEVQDAISQVQKKGKVSMLNKFNSLPDWYEGLSNEAFKFHERLINDWAVKTRRCVMCQVDVWSPQDQHLNGRGHRLASWIMSRLDAQMGCPKNGPGTRIYTQGYKTEAHQEVDLHDLAGYWGSDILSWPSTVKQQLDQGIKIKMAKSKPTVEVPGAHIAATNLVFCNYEGAGQGKYSRRHQMVHPHLLPCKFSESCMVWPLLIISFDEEFAASYSVPSVVADDDDGDDDPCQIKVLYADNENAEAISPDGWREKSCWAICAYQACEIKPQAWPVLLRRG